jgi:pimeloyl-ACP methyl ester carboxylesterase
MTLRRRILLALTSLISLLAGGCATTDEEPPPPIVFVHGNGDTAALWHTTIWRFESNGWPRDRLHAIDLPYPTARDEDDKPQAGRSSTAEHMRFLATEVQRVLVNTGAEKVVLIGSSLGGNAIRNFIANGGGAKWVSHAILAGTPNHGVWNNPKFQPGSEFNGASPFLTALNNQGGAGVEVTSGVKWMTLRSDTNDKYAQPSLSGAPSNVTHEGPALKGADNVVLPARDHREVAFHPEAFVQMFRFVVGAPPVSAGIAPEAHVVLDGKVSGLGVNGVGALPNNLPLAGATLEVYRTDTASGGRVGNALHRKVVGEDGRWGPFVAQPDAAYEFVISAPGYAVTHVYRSPFPRSSNFVNLRAERLAEADKSAAAVVTLTRPRGYFGVPRDQISFDGQSPPPGVPAGVATVSSSKLKLTDASPRRIVGEFNGERVIGRPWPAAEGHVVTLELHY